VINDLQQNYVAGLRVLLILLKAQKLAIGFNIKPIYEEVSQEEGLPESQDEAAAQEDVQEPVAQEQA
jgi:hypothetical protein